MNAPIAADADDDVLLRVEEVEHEYEMNSSPFRASRKLLSVAGVSLQIKNGEVLGLVGESGCGKSTLAKIVLGLLPPSRGRVRIAGKDIGDVNRVARARLVQPVFQDPYGSLNPNRPIGASIALPLSVLGIGNSRQDRKSLVCEMLDKVGLPHSYYDRFPSQLSGGQRQRVAIARALITKPKLLVCDEPTSALDVSVQSQILNLLEDLRQQFGLTFLFISHNMAVVEHFATRVAVMYRGEIVEEGEAEQIFSKPAHSYTRNLLASVLTTDPGAPLPDLGRT